MIMKDFEIVKVSKRKVSCDGGKAALGHPKVYLNIKDNETSIVCPYCSRKFEL